MRPPSLPASLGPHDRQFSELTSRWPESCPPPPYMLETPSNQSLLSLASRGLSPPPSPCFRQELSLSKDKLKEFWNDLCLWRLSMASFNPSR